MCTPQMSDMMRQMMNGQMQQQMPTTLQPMGAPLQASAGAPLMPLMAPVPSGGPQVSYSPQMAMAAQHSQESAIAQRVMDILNAQRAQHIVQQMQHSGVQQ